MSKTIKVFSPATIGNIGPGFDVLGLAVKGMGDIVEVWKIPGNKIVIEEIENADHPISKDPDKNTAGIAAREVLRLLKLKAGIGMRITKGMPAGSGLGSSAASAAAAANAVNCLFGNSLSKEQVLKAAMAGESSVSGGYFADNVAPAIYGGATLTRSLNPLEVTPLGIISDLIIILVMPKVKILTKDSRKRLPENIPLSDFVVNLANTASITAAFCKNDYSLLKENLKDLAIESHRSKFIPGFEKVKIAALDSGADGMAISGSGPTVFAITNSKKKAKIIEKEMEYEFNNHGIKCNTLVTVPSKNGSRTINGIN